MISYVNHLGSVRISQSYFQRLIGNAVSSCYGVTTMVPGVSQRIRSRIVNRDLEDSGIYVKGNKDKIVVSLHIGVIFGMNISAISKSIINKVTYVVEQATGIKVSRVIVHIDTISED